MIFYDHTDTGYKRVTTGIQRVVTQLGQNLASMVPGAFVPVIYFRGKFHAVDLEVVGGPRTFHPIRRLLRERAGFPFNALRTLTNEHSRLSQLKARIWNSLERPSVRGSVVQPGAGEWYLTADSIWVHSDILEMLPRLRMAGVRTAAVHYDLIPILHPEWVEPDHSELFTRYASALTSFDVVFCISGFVRQQFIKFCQTRGYSIPKRVVTIPLGYELAQRRASSAAKQGELPAGKFVLCVGSLEPRKNQGRLVEAFDMLWKRGSELSLVFVGVPGYKGEEIFSMIHHHSRFGRTLFHLPDCCDEELERLYRHCGFTVLPSLFEGFGLPLVESLARGKPSVCSDLEVFRDVAGQFAIYFNPEDPASIAAQIESLSNPQRLEALAASIRSEYSPPSWKDCARVVSTVLGFTQVAS